MATATFKSIYDEAVVLAGVSFDYTLLNRALRWVWRTDDPLFAWPETVTSSASITITSGVIAWTAVSSSDWCSFWESDPSVYTPDTNFLVNAVPVTWDGVQFRTQSATVTSPCFAYWRTAVPQGSSATDASTTVPLELKDITLEYAIYLYFRSNGSMERAKDARELAQELMEGRKAGFLNANIRFPWDQNINVVQF